MSDRNALTHKDLSRLQSFLLDSLSDAVIAHTFDGRLVYANEAFCRQKGISPAELSKVPPFGWLSPMGRLRQAEIRDRLASEGSIEFETAMETLDGIRHAVVHAQTIFLNGETIVLSIARDETARRAALSDLEFKSMLLDSANDAIIVHDLEGRILHVNETACEQRGFTAEELLGRRLDEWVTGDRAAHIEAVTAQLRRDGQAVFESADVCKDGSVIPVEVRARLVTIEGREVVLSVVRDIRDRKRVDRAIERFAYYDPLTDLPNRRLFMDRLERAIAHLPRSGETLAVLFIDIDNLKTVNDTLGHAAGDRILVAAADRLRRLVRNDDTVARLAGDEFTILLMDTDEKAACEAAERICEAMREPLYVQGQRMFMTACVGVAVADADTTEPETLLRDADLAMYSVKTGPRDGYMLYHPRMSEAAIDKFNLTNDLRAAIDNSELALFYQPLVRLSDKQVVGAEALLRWTSPTRGSVSPVEFIPVAEETGIIIPLGEWVLRTACAQHAAWREAGHTLRVAVNLSPRQIMQGGLVDVVDATLREHDMDASFLELEVTESVALNRSPLVQTTLVELASLGVRIAIDDFGTGYSSLSHLQSLPIDTLKVDRSFIGSIHEAASAQIARAVLALGQGLNLNVVAEGVETDEQYAFLAEHACSECQGFLFSPAVPPEEFVRLLGT